MAPPFTLAAVLALRQRNEEREELALAAASRQLCERQETLLRVDRELAGWSEARAREIGSVRDAAAQQALYARHAALRQARAQLQQEIGRLGSLRQKQQQVYLAARSAREMLTELQAQQASTWSKQQELVEQRRLDDLFSARRRKQ